MDTIEQEMAAAGPARPQGLAPLRSISNTPPSPDEALPGDDTGSGGDGYASASATYARPTAGSRRPPLQFPNPKAEARVLSDRDASRYRRDLVEGIQWLARHADDAILASTPGEMEYPPPPPMPIWGDMDEAECGLLADMWIDFGKRYVVIAQTVRGAVKVWSYLEVGEITVPRAIQTFQWYARYGLYIHLGFMKVELVPSRVRRARAQEGPYAQ